MTSGCARKSISRSYLASMHRSRERLPKRVMLYIDPGPWGHVAEWLRNGLQNRVHQFNSGRGLHLNH
jgi:hypothetical protein